MVCAGKICGCCENARHVPDAGRHGEGLPRARYRSPISKEKAVILPDDPNQIDILIGTDCRWREVGPRL